jgi:hypothetical protein
MGADTWSGASPAILFIRSDTITFYQDSVKIANSLAL